MNRPAPRLLMIRPEADSRRFLDALPVAVRQGAVVSPLMRIVTRQPAPDLSGAAGVILTSANGVEAAAQMDVLARGPAFCVGPRTTAAAAAQGWEAEMAGACADALVETLLRTRPRAPLVHLRGAHGRGAVARRLAEAGIATSEAVIYEQLETGPSDAARRLLDGVDPVLVPLFSPRSAKLFCALGPVRAPLVLPAISASAALPVRHLPGAEVHIAASPDGEAMRKLVEKLVNPSRRVEGSRGPQ